MTGRAALKTTIYAASSDRAGLVAAWDVIRAPSSDRAGLVAA